MKLKSPPAKLLFAVSILAIAPCLSAQTAPAEPASKAASADDKDTIVLSPFVVQASEDTGYAAQDTLAGTRVRTSLKDLASSIQVVTAKFMQDLGATKASDILQYTTNTEVAGPRGNITGGTITSKGLNTGGLREQPQYGTRVRGLSPADLTRDLFLTDIPFDSYNTGRIDIQRGANSILFGLGSPSGIVNGSTNAASFKNQNTVEARVGSWGSIRGSIDINRVLLEDELALRFDSVDDRTEYQQKPAYNHDRRVYGALRYDPKSLAQGSAHTSFRLNYENGNVESNQPRVTPPVDRFSDWWTKLNKQTFDPANFVADRAANAATLGATGRIYTELAAVFPDANGSGQGGGAVPGYMILQRGGALPEIGWSNPIGVSELNDFPKFPFTHDHVITDTSVFDYYNQLLDGPNKREWQNFNAFNATLNQTFLNNHAGFELAYDHQEYASGTTDNTGVDWILIDINTKLIDGRPNPNLGRPYMTNESGGNRGSTKRDTYRATGFYEFDFKDVLKQSRFADFLGRHVFTGVYNDQDVHSDGANWQGYRAEPASYGAATNADPKNPTASTQIISLRYLGGSLAGLSSPAGAHIPGLSAIQIPMSGATGLYWDPHPKAGVTLTDANQLDPASYVGWVNGPINIQSVENGDINQLYNGASKNRSTVKSKSLVWQGFLFDGNLVPLVGWREDTAKSWSASAPPRVGADGVDINSPSFGLPKLPNNTITGRTTSYSLVAHTPEFIRNKMPFHTGISLFYNKADNFQPAAGRSDLFGRPQPPPSGNTKDYGFTISTLDDRLTFKATWYESTIHNATSQAFSDIQWWLGAVEVWGYPYAFASWNDDKPAARAAYIAGLPSKEFQDAWGWVPDKNTTTGNFNPPSGLTALVTQQSKGLELEMYAKLTKNWDFTFNASREKAIETDVAKEMVSYIQSRIDYYEGPAGDIVWWDANSTQTARDWARGNVEIPFIAAIAQQGKAVPELRKWRFNAISNYKFNEGFLKNVNIGGAVRWQDKIVTGYASKMLNDLPIFDIDKPYYGPSEVNYDMWFGYERKLTHKINWRIQLNVRNLFAKKELIPTVQDYDGTMAVGRIPELTNWYLTNTFTF